MGIKRVKVGDETSSTTSEGVRTSAWTDNGGTFSTLSAPLRKILAGISISQLVIVVVTAATLGAFINSNVSYGIFYLARALDTEANILYDRNHHMYDAALLTRCYTQHALRPFIYSESNHIRRFIKIFFINKGIDFIDLRSIFQYKLLIQSIHTYFQNSEPRIICYKYNKPIRNTIFNFNKLVSDLEIHAMA